MTPQPNRSLYSIAAPLDKRLGGMTKAVGDRAKGSETVLEMHYDSRSEEEKMEQRREYLDDL